MALVHPRFVGHLRLAGQVKGVHEHAHHPIGHIIEVYLDYVCPFSAKMFMTLYRDVFPKMEKMPVEHKICFVFRHQVQPWHPSSTLTHEAALAVERVHFDRFWKFSEAIFENQRAYFDAATAAESRGETYERLAKLAAESNTADAKAVLDLLRVEAGLKGQPGGNGGNAVTDDLKLHIKAARQQSIHFSPTVVTNGIVDNSISSNWTADEWIKYVAKLQ